MIVQDIADVPNMFYISDVYFVSKSERLNGDCKQKLMQNFAFLTP